MEDVGLLQVVELVGPADEASGGEAPVGEVVEEHLVRHQARHCDHPPAGQGLQLLVHDPEVGDPVAVQVESLQPVQERLAGAPVEQRFLALIQGDPDPVILGAVAGPVLVDGPVGPCADRRNGLSERIRAHVSIYAHLRQKLQGG